jgi:lysophospholipase L1-like esterase
MKIIKIPPPGLVLVLLALNSCAVATDSTTTRDFQPASQEPPTQRLAAQIPASDPRFRYEGRFDFSDSNAPVIVWQASRISIDFGGDAVVPLFGDVNGQCFFNAQVDGLNSVIAIREGQPGRPPIIATFGSGRHHLEFFKRSEADAGTVRFRGIFVMHSAEAWAPSAPVLRLRMEFLGDSITVGACNEDGPEDQWTNRLTHNAALSYAALTADAFSADYRNIAVSGMGIVNGYVDKKAGEVWDKIYPNPASPRANLTNWTPQVVFVNFGENDDSFSRVHGQPFPAGYTEGYITLIRAIRAAYPAAHIVLLRGGMFGGAQSEPLRRAWESAAAQLEAADPAVSHFVIAHWTPAHPRVADDRAMADELIAWLKQQSFMQTDRPAANGLK